LKVSAYVKISVECFENFGGANAPNAPPGCVPVSDYSTANAFLLFTPHMTVLNKVVQPNYRRT